MSKFDINDIGLLITGCISPIRTQKNLYLKNVEQREKQYIDSIEYYICNTSIKWIVFCENSNFHSKYLDSLIILAEKNNKKFEWISFEGDSFKVQERGKGYGEGEIVKYALEKSEVLKKTKYFLKVTGRLKVLNINSICNKLSFCPAFNYDIYRTNAYDTRFYFVEKEFYIKYLEDLYLYVNEEENDIIALEDIFYKRLSSYEVNCLPYYPKFEGVSGGNGTDYGKMLTRSFYFYNILCFFKIFNNFYPSYINMKRKIIG